MGIGIKLAISCKAGGYCRFGFPVSISADATRVAVGSSSYAGGSISCLDWIENEFNESGKGMARVLEYSDGGDWTQMGLGFEWEEEGGGYLVRRYHYLETDPPLPLGQIAMI